MPDYIKKTLVEAGLENSKKKETPIASREKPLLAETQIINSDIPFRRFLGKLAWINKVQPALNYVVNALCKVAHKPSKQASTVLKRSLRFLIGLEDVGLEFKKMSTKRLIGFADANLMQTVRTLEALALHSYSMAKTW